MQKNATQYTIRRIPRELDRRLKKLARERGVSLNSFIVECLARQADLAPDKQTYHDLDHLAGTWVHDDEMDAALEDQRRIDEDMWK